MNNLKYSDEFQKKLHQPWVLLEQPHTQKSYLHIWMQMEENLLYNKYTVCLLTVEDLHKVLWSE